MTTITKKFVYVHQTEAAAGNEVRYSYNNSSYDPTADNAADYKTTLADLVGNGSDSNHASTLNQIHITLHQDNILGDVNLFTLEGVDFKMGLVVENDTVDRIVRLNGLSIGESLEDAGYTFNYIARHTKFGREAANNKYVELEGENVMYLTHNDYITHSTGPVKFRLEGNSTKPLTFKYKQNSVAGRITKCLAQDIQFYNDHANDRNTTVKPLRDASLIHGDIQWLTQAGSDTRNLIKIANSATWKDSVFENGVEFIIENVHVNEDRKITITFDDCEFKNSLDASLFSINKQNISYLTFDFKNANNKFTYESNNVKVVDLTPCSPEGTENILFLGTTPIVVNNSTFDMRTTWNKSIQDRNSSANEISLNSVFYSDILNVSGNVTLQHMDTIVRDLDINILDNATINLEGNKYDYTLTFTGRNSTNTADKERELTLKATGHMTLKNRLILNSISKVIFDSHKYTFNITDDSADYNNIFGVPVEFVNWGNVDANYETNQTSINYNGTDDSLKEHLFDAGKVVNITATTINLQSDVDTVKFQPIRSEDITFKSSETNQLRIVDNLRLKSYNYTLTDLEFKETIEIANTTADKTLVLDNCKFQNSYKAVGGTERHDGLLKYISDTYDYTVTFQNKFEYDNMGADSKIIYYGDKLSLAKGSELNIVFKLLDAQTFSENHYDCMKEMNDMGDPTTFEVQLPNNSDATIAYHKNASRDDFNTAYAKVTTLRVGINNVEMTIKGMYCNLSTVQTTTGNDKILTLKSVKDDSSDDHAIYQSLTSNAKYKFHSSAVVLDISADVDTTDVVTEVQAGALFLYSTLNVDNIRSNGLHAQAKNSVSGYAKPVMGLFHDGGTTSASYDANFTSGLQVAEYALLGVTLNLLSYNVESGRKSYQFDNVKDGLTLETLNTFSAEYKYTDSGVPNGSTGMYTGLSSMDVASTKTPIFRASFGTSAQNEDAVITNNARLYVTDTIDTTNHVGDDPPFFLSGSSTGLMIVSNLMFNNDYKTAGMFVETGKQKFFSGLNPNAVNNIPNNLIYLGDRFPLRDVMTITKGNNMIDFTASPREHAAAGLNIKGYTKKDAGTSPTVNTANYGAVLEVIGGALTDADDLDVKLGDGYHGSLFTSNMVDPGKHALTELNEVNVSMGGLQAGQSSTGAGLHIGVSVKKININATPFINVDSPCMLHYDNDSSTTLVVTNTNPSNQVYLCVKNSGAGTLSISTEQGDGISIDKYGKYGTVLLLSNTEDNTMYTEYLGTHAVYPNGTSDEVLRNIGPGNIAGGSDRLLIVTDQVSADTINTNRWGPMYGRDDFDINYARKDSQELELDLHESNFRHCHATLGNKYYRPDVAREYLLKNLATSELGAGEQPPTPMVPGSAQNMRINSDITINGMRDSTSSSSVLTQVPFAIVNATESDPAVLPIVTLKDTKFKLIPKNTVAEFLHPLKDTHDCKWNMTDSNNKIEIHEPASISDTIVGQLHKSGPPKLDGAAFGGDIRVLKGATNEITDLDLSLMESYFRNNGKAKFLIYLEQMHSLNLGDLSQDTTLEIQATGSSKDVTLNGIQAESASQVARTLTFTLNALNDVTLGSHTETEDVNFAVTGTGNGKTINKLTLGGNITGANNNAADTAMLTVDNLTVKSELCYALAADTPRACRLIDTTSDVVLGTASQKCSVKVKEPTNSKIYGYMANTFPSGRNPEFTRDHNAIGADVLFANKDPTPKTDGTGEIFTGVQMWTVDDVVLKLKVTLNSAKYDNADGNLVDVPPGALTAANNDLKANYTNYWTRALQSSDVSNKNLVTLAKTQGTAFPTQEYKSVAGSGSSAPTYIANTLEYNFAILNSDDTLNHALGTYTHQDVILETAVTSAIGYDAGSTDKTQTHTLSVSHDAQPNNDVSVTAQLNKLVMTGTAGRTLLCGINFMTVGTNFAPKPKYSWTSNNGDKSDAYDIDIVADSDFSSFIEGKISPYIGNGTYTLAASADAETVRLSVASSLNDYYPHTSVAYTWNYLQANFGSVQFGDPIKLAPFNKTNLAIGDLYTHSVNTAITPETRHYSSSTLPVNQVITQAFKLTFTAQNTYWTYKTTNQIFNPSDLVVKIKEGSGGTVSATSAEDLIVNGMTSRISFPNFATQTRKSDTQVAFPSGQTEYSKPTTFTVDCVLTINVGSNTTWAQLNNHLGKFTHLDVSYKCTQNHITEIWDTAWHDSDQQSCQYSKSTALAENSTNNAMSNTVSNEGLKYTAIVSIAQGNSFNSIALTDLDGYKIEYSDSNSALNKDVVFGAALSDPTAVTETNNFNTFDLYILSNDHSNMQWKYTQNNLNYRLVGDNPAGTRMRLNRSAYSSWAVNSSDVLDIGTESAVSAETNIRLDHSCILYKFRLVLNNPSDIRLRDVIATLENDTNGVLAGTKRITYTDQSALPTMTVTAHTNTGDLNDDSQNKNDNGVLTFINSDNKTYSHTLFKDDDNTFNLTDGASELHLTPTTMPNPAKDDNLTIELALTQSILQEATFTFIVKDGAGNVLGPDDRTQPNLDEAAMIPSDNKFTLVIPHISKILQNINDTIIMNMQFTEQAADDVVGDRSVIQDDAFNSFFKIVRQNGESIVLPEPVTNENGVPIVRYASHLQFNNWIITQESRKGSDNNDYDDLIFSNGGVNAFRITLDPNPPPLN